MKRTFLILIALLTLCFAMAAPVSAASGDFVTDSAGILTDQQRQELNSKAADISAKYECDVRIYVAKDMGTSGAYEYAKNVYRDNGFGYGPDKSGVLFMLSMKERDYSLIAFGFGNTAFTDHGKDVMLDNFILPKLKDDKFYDAFLAYLNKAEEFLGMARAGTPFDLNTDPAVQARSKAGLIVVNIIIPIVVALIVCLIFRSQMKTARRQRAAASYIPEGGFVLTKSNDTYLHSTEVRKAVEDKSSGGTTTDSSGFSGRSGKF